MKQLNDPCWRLDGRAYLALPDRVRLPDGTTRTDPEQWSADPEVLAATGWERSTLTQADLDRLYPQPMPEPADPLSVGYETPEGWRLGWQADDVALLTGLYVLARRADELGISQPVVVTDTAGQSHELTLAEFEPLMLGYGSARAALSASNVT
jgi:hypothetical protein